MEIQFPEGFIWGTSTAAAQIETATDHEWKGVKSKDGYIFDRTIDHEKRRDEDLEYICQFGAYRMGVDWARLQPTPNAPFDPEVVKEYRDFMIKLKERGVYIMLVIHHFTNPNWFVQLGSWEKERTLPFFVDYAKKVVEHFGDLTDNWNTFNEPGVYAFNGFLTGHFPPFKKSLGLMQRVLANLGKAHHTIFPIIKDKYPDKPIGISKNAVIFYPMNVMGKVPAKIADKLFMETTADHFVEQLDYLGVSYYARIGFDPFPVSEVDTPGKLDKLGKRHDKMWEYYPQGLHETLLRFHKRYGKPFFITENGICSDDCDERIESIKDYLRLIKDVQDRGIEVKGYFHWSTFDNFEWSLGPSYRFGLVNVDMNTMERSMKKSGLFYKSIVENNGF